MTEKPNNHEGRVVPNPSTIREDMPGDAADDANAIRFSEEQALIEEQARGIRPETYNVPGGPTLEEARGNLDLPTEDADNTPSSDSSDDGLHGGAEH